MDARMDMHLINLHICIAVFAIPLIPKWLSGDTRETCERQLVLETRK